MESDFTPTDEALAIRARLEELAARPTWGPRKIHLRIATPNLRSIVRERSAIVAGASDEELSALIDLLWSGVTYDEMFIAVEIVKLRISLLTEGRIERWRGWLDNWSITDDFASVVRIWLSEDPDARFAYIEGLAAGDDVWSRRLGIASTILLSREGRNLDRSLALIDRTVGDRRKMIVNAQSWALREMIKSDPARVERYVEEHHERLPARVRLEVWNKLRTGRKDGKGPGLKKRMAQRSDERRTKRRRGSP